MPKKKKKVARDPLSPWRQIVVDAAAWAAEPLQGVLLEEGALGTELIDDSTRAMPGRPAMPTGRVTIIAPFSRDAPTNISAGASAVGLEARVTGALGHVIKYLEASVGPAEMEIAWSDLWPEDYQAAFKASWKPIALSERIFIVPTWDEDFVAPANSVCLRLDPGMAFGTGSHPTTRLCARALEALFDSDGEATLAKKRLLDVGTGTGILSIIALMLGAEAAVGTDIDSAALLAAKENAEQNGVGRRFKLHNQLPDRDGAIFDVVVANILASPLLDLAAPISRAIKPGGRLILSGILEEQAGSLENAYLALGLKRHARVIEEGWVRLDFDA